MNIFNKKCDHNIEWDTSKFKGIYPMKVYGFCKKCNTLFVKEVLDNGKETIRKQKSY